MPVKPAWKQKKIHLCIKGKFCTSEGRNVWRLNQFYFKRGHKYVMLEIFLTSSYVSELEEPITANNVSADQWGKSQCEALSSGERHPLRKNRNRVKTGSFNSEQSSRLRQVSVPQWFIQCKASPVNQQSAKSRCWCRKVWNEMILTMSNSTEVKSSLLRCEHTWCFHSVHQSILSVGFFLESDLNSDQEVRCTK